MGTSDGIRSSVEIRTPYLTCHYFVDDRMRPGRVRAVDGCTESKPLVHVFIPRNPAFLYKTCFPAAYLPPDCQLWWRSGSTADRRDAGRSAGSANCQASPRLSQRAIGVNGEASGESGRVSGISFGRALKTTEEDLFRLVLQCLHPRQLRVDEFVLPQLSEARTGVALFEFPF